MGGAALFVAALTRSGRLKAWATPGGAWQGNASKYGLLDVPSLPESETFVDCAGGTGHAAALTSRGRILAWGLNPLGQCTVPVLLAGEKYVSMFCGDCCTGGVTSNGRFLVWGGGDEGPMLRDVPLLPTGEKWVAPSFDVVESSTVTPSICQCQCAIS